MGKIDSYIFLPKTRLVYLLSCDTLYIFSIQNENLIKREAILEVLRIKNPKSYFIRLLHTERNFCILSFNKDSSHTLGFSKRVSFLELDDSLNTISNHIFLMDKEITIEEQDFYSSYYAIFLNNKSLYIDNLLLRDFILSGGKIIEPINKNNDQFIIDIMNKDSIGIRKIMVNGIIKGYYYYNNNNYLDTILVNKKDTFLCKFNYPINGTLVNKKLFFIHSKYLDLQKKKWFIFSPFISVYRPINNGKEVYWKEGSKIKSQEIK
ncbi:MAG: hypothetical protein ACOYMA_12405 [Bacteroidia bacterium]